MTPEIFLLDFAFYYPLFMAYLWMIGGVTYYLHYERKNHLVKDPLALLAETPLVSVIVPCFNEEDNIHEVVETLSELNYPDYEIICINDGSKDKTGAMLDELTKTYPKLRVIHQAKNQGKAVALNTAALMARGEFLLCMDGDAILDRNIIPWMLHHFENGPRVGAVTGNPRIRTRSTLLGRLQVGEFSSIIGLIKRTQRVYGRIFTVSGVVAMFRRRALLQVGFWSPDMLTEDIDISWKLQTRHWEIRFEPHAMCWILTPETLAGLWKQRLRWAMGGIQVIQKYFFTLFTWRERRMWAIFAEYLISVFWAYSMAAIIAIWLIGFVIELPVRWQMSIVPNWQGVLIGTTCILQILTSMLLDRRYDHKIFRHFFWLIWYPVAYWLLTMATMVWAVPKAFIRQRGMRALWVSPDRGLRIPTEPSEPTKPLTKTKSNENTDF